MHRDDDADKTETVSDRLTDLLHRELRAASATARERGLDPTAVNEAMAERMRRLRELKTAGRSTEADRPAP